MGSIAQEMNIQEEILRKERELEGARRKIQWEGDNNVILMCLIYHRQTGAVAEGKVSGIVSETDRERERERERE